MFERAVRRWPELSRGANIGARLQLLVIISTGCATVPAGRQWVDTVSLTGAEQVDQRTLLAGLETQATPWWWWLPTFERRWFSSASLDRDLKRIVRYFAASGFFAARIARTTVSPSGDDSGVAVRIDVDRGSPCATGPVELQGLDSLGASAGTALRRTIGLPRGRFSHGVYSEAKQRLLNQLRNQGYAYAVVKGEVRVSPDKRRCGVRLISRVGPLVRYGQPHIVGLGELPRDQIERLFEFRQGQRFAAGDLSRTRAKLYRLGVFSFVRLDLPKEPTAVANVAVTLKPGRMRELRVGGGFGFERRRHELRLRSEFAWRNFLGGLRELRVRIRPAFVAITSLWNAQRSGLALISDVQLTQPDIFGSGISLFGLSGYDVGVHEGYKFHGPRWQVGAERKAWRDQLRTGLSWNLQLLDFFSVLDSLDEADTALGPGFVDPYRVAWLEPFVRLDLRDDRLDPRSGFWAELRLEQGLRPLASAFSYTKLTPEIRGYLPLFAKRLVVAIRSMLGYLRPIASSSGVQAADGGAASPITRRFTLGGPTSHRGFSFGRLSPQGDTSGSQRVPRGGDGALLFSVDLRWRMARLFGHWLSASTFVDAGDVTEDFAGLDLSRLHWAVGGGLQYNTPIGVARLALGVRLNRLSACEVGAEAVGSCQLDNPDPSRRFAFHLTIGTAF